MFKHKAFKVEAMFVPRKLLEQKLIQSLIEDVGQGDITAAAIVPQGLSIQAEVVAKTQGIIAGVEETSILAEGLEVKVKVEVADGQEVKAGQRLMLLSGDARTILSAERTMLNLLSRMSGIATATRKLTTKIQNANLKTRIAATRKTALGFSYFDKKAVIVGGGDAHRLHLDDMILIKDNHRVVAGSLKVALKRVKENASFSKKIEVEISEPADALEAAQLGADIIMLDNFLPKQINEAITLLKNAGYFGKIILEASGRITEENVLDYAATGVDLISLGTLTHSVKALDISLEVLALK